MAILISAVSKRTTVSVIASIMIWAVFTFMISVVALMIAFSSVPIRIQPGQNITITPELREELMRRAAIIETANMFTPNYHFSRAANYILRAFISVGLAPTGPSPGQSPPQPPQREVSIAESLASAWPNILVLALIAAFTLMATYMIFVRQETR